MIHSHSWRIISSVGKNMKVNQWMKWYDIMCHVMLCMQSNTNANEPVAADLRKKDREREIQ